VSFNGVPILLEPCLRTAKQTGLVYRSTRERAGCGSSAPLVAKRPQGRACQKNRRTKSVSVARLVGAFFRRASCDSGLFLQTTDLSLRDKAFQAELLAYKQAHPNLSLGLRVECSQ